MGIRQEGKAPRGHQPRDWNDADAHDFRGVEFDGLGRHRQWFEPSGGDWYTAVERNRLLGRYELDSEERTGDAEPETGLL